MTRIFQVNLHRFRCLVSLSVVFSLTSGAVLAQENSKAASASKMKYPETKAVDVIDDYHGRKVADPYRWLEDTESEQTADWIAAENKITQRYLQSIPARKTMQQRLKKLWNYERFGMPSHRGETYFYTHNDGLQNQSVYYKAASLEAPRQVLLNPNTLSEDGTVALAGAVASKDGKLLAYGLADGGSDWQT